MREEGTERGRVGPCSTSTLTPFLTPFHLPLDPFYLIVTEVHRLLPLNVRLVSRKETTLNPLTEGWGTPRPLSQRGPGETPLTHSRNGSTT